MIRSLAVNPLVFTKHSDAAPRQSGWTAFVVRIDPQRWKLLHQLIDYGWHRWRRRLWLRVSYADASCESDDARTSDDGARRDDQACGRAAQAVLSSTGASERFRLCVSCLELVDVTQASGSALYETTSPAIGGRINL